MTNVRLPEIPTVMSKFDIWCVRQVQHLLTEEASINYLNVYDKYLNEYATIEDVKLARSMIRSFEWEVVRVVVSGAIFGNYPRAFFEDSWMVRFRDAHAEYVKSGTIPEMDGKSEKLRFSPHYPTR